MPLQRINLIILFLQDRMYPLNINLIILLEINFLHYPLDLSLKFLVYADQLLILLSEFFNGSDLSPVSLLEF
jgi:hypothetical protein